MAVSNSPGPYFQYVQSLAGPFPRLQLLVDFMSPQFRIKDYHNDENVVQRMKKVDVDVIDLGSQTPSLSKFDTIDALSGHINAPREANSVQVILVENVSADVIELLGSKYRLDPRFFENYVRDIQGFLTDKWEGDRTKRVQSSLPEVLQQSFIQLKHSRPYVFKGWDAAWRARVNLNVPRMGNRTLSLFLRESTAIYGPVQGHNASTTFVLLCDPLLDDALPKEIHLRNNGKMPMFDPTLEYKTIANQQKHVSIRCTLENVLLESQPSTSNDTRALLLHTIITTGLDFHAAAIKELSLRRYRLTSRYSYRPKDSFRSIVESLNMGGGWMDLHNSVHRSMTLMKNVGIPSLPDGELRKSLELDFNHLEYKHKQSHQRQSQILEFLRQEQEINFTRSVERLTIIAFLFLPFSTMATILSINDTMRFGVFFALAIPVSVVCIAFGIRGTSLAEISTRTKGLGTEVHNWTGLNFRRLFPLTCRDENVAGLDLESKPEVAGPFDLYQKVLEEKYGYDGRSMNTLISEVENRPSLRQRGSEKSKSEMM